MIRTNLVHLREAIIVMQNNTHSYCINVLKVFDWITKLTEIKIRKSLDHTKLVTDKICGNIELTCGENGLLWKGNGDINISGVVTIFHDMGVCERMEVIVNKKPAFFLSQGEERTVDFHLLKSLEVRCRGNENGFCIGKYCLIIRYQLNNISYNPEDFEINCFLSDENGNPTDILECQEITQSNGRHNVDVILPDGQIGIVQRVKVLIRGFVTVQIKNNGELCKLCTFPFKKIEELILCAPLGTFLKCEITDFECTAYFTEYCKEIVIEISFCQQVQVVENVTIEVEANLCLPHP